MILAREVAQEAGFVDGVAGRRWRIVSQPADGHWVGTVIWVHAFAEELNKTRRMSALMARRLASEGWRVVQTDLSGCGDSDGDFGDATWSAWIEDLKSELSGADPQRPIWLWCVRAGALLAAAALDERPALHLLLWQPVTAGARHLQQFLRLQTGARVLGSAKAEANALPAQALAAGSAVEVGGYLLAPALAAGLGSASFDVPSGFSGRIVWLELSSDEEPALPPVVKKAVERLRARGVAVDVEALAGPPFWQTQEIEECEALLERSSQALATADRSMGGVATVTGIARDERVPASDPPSAERPLSFRCGDERLWGVFAPASATAEHRSVAVVIAVGGPQYRIGSHRQFVLLARRLAQHGYASLRFDYRGMGDSEGARRTFEDVGADLQASISALQAACPAASRIVVWGLCDAASTAMMQAALHPSVAGIVAVNPWARSEASLAAVHVRHYYLARLAQADFWAKLLRGGLDVRSALGGLLGNIKRASTAAPPDRRDTFQDRMAKGIRAFHGQVLLILAGNDLTAKEFMQHAGASPQWRGVLEHDRISRFDLVPADHTFSSATWRRQVEDATIAWLQGLPQDQSPTQSVAPQAGVTFYRQEASKAG